MAKGLQNYPDIETPAGNFPDGRIKDFTPSIKGTDINQFTNDDLHQVFAKLLRIANIVPNGLPENENDGFEYIDALGKVAGRNFVSITTDVSYTEIDPIQVCEEFNGVRLRGRIQYNNASGLTVATGIPVSARPTLDRLVAMDIFDSATNKILFRANVKITTVGAVEFIDTDYASITGTDRLVFDGAYYQI